jgi:hypothetical protein
MVVHGVDAPALRSTAVEHEPLPRAVFEQAGVEPPAPGRSVRIPLGRLRLVEGPGGRLEWRVDASDRVGAYFELSAD